MKGRTSGILLPVFSLPGPYGIGCFSEEACRFADFLKKAGQTYWQILPVGPTGYGDSPYQSFSTFAGNPYFISLEKLIGEGLLTKEECGGAYEGAGAGQVDYGLQYERRLPLLKLAFSRSRFREEAEYKAFLEENGYWLEDYALFMAVKDAHGGRSLENWEEDIRARRPDAVRAWSERLSEETDFYRFVQYTFLRQWKELRAYTNRLGIRLIGDIPIYVSADSADFWAHRDLFLLDERGRIRMVAGVPPDGFSADGQLWGNPLYDWPHHAQTGYDWWIRRIAKCRELYDVIRIDHFRGFDEYFAIPAGSTSAAGGHWEKGPGAGLFDVLKARFPDLEIIAEDLGYMKDSVRELVKQTGFPNMKVLEFAFDSRDSSGAAEYLPYRYERGSVVYTGTHDNETVRGWLDSILPEERAMVNEYLGVMTDDPAEAVDKMVRAALSCVADTCIIPLQDYLGLDNSARINQPSTFGKNWKWRLDPETIDDALAQRIRSLCSLYGRNTEV